MKKYKQVSRLFSLLLLLVIFSTACTREGFDGDSNVTGTVAHHGLAIGEASIFIKFGAKELPGTLVSDFDASTVADSKGVFKFENLKKGEYYLYGIGTDTAINETVRGGRAFVIEEKGQDLTVDVAVTE